MPSRPRRYPLFPRRALLPLVTLIGMAGMARAEDPATVSLALMPARIVAVKGDAAQFRALTSINDGSASGIKALNIDTPVGKDATVSVEGRSSPADHDEAGTLTLRRGDEGYVTVHYKTFRRYFDAKGGYFPFQTLAVNTLPQDLSLDVGHFSVELGRGEAADPALAFAYARDTKDGSKDRLTWGSVKDQAFGVNGVVRKTAPSFATLDETTDTLAVRGKADLAGFTVRGEQKYTFFNAHDRRQDQQLVSPVPSPLTNETRVNVLEQSPQTKELASTLRAERWSLSEKTFVGMGYRFSHLRNSMVETEREYTPSLTPTAIWTGQRNRDGYARNSVDTHTWTGNLLSNVTENLSLTARLRAEAKSTNAFSDYGVDTTPTVAGTVVPDGIANHTYHGTNEEKQVNTAENIAFKYSGVPRTSLYGELEFAQDRLWQSQGRHRTAGQTPGADGGDDFYFETNDITPAASGKLGTRLTPWRSLTLTTELTYKRTDYKRNMVQVTNQEDWAIPDINKVRIREEAVTQRLAWKPLKWMQHAFTAKAAGTVYHTQSFDDDRVKSQQVQRDLAYDLTLIPSGQWMVNVGYSLQRFKASTPAAQPFLSGTTYSYLPVYTGNVHSWIAGVSYAPRANLSLFHTLSYSRAKNANNNYNVSATDGTGAFLYGSDQEWYEAGMGLDWSPRRNVSLKPHYAYYGLRSFEGLETGNYSAHVLWLDVDVTW